MGCCGDREKFGDLRVEQKWEYINLDDFKARSCWAGFAYGYLIFMLFVSISVYAVDTFTAINLLAFDRWAGRIEPAIPLHISRWIFAGCIILSFVLLIYRWIRAIRVIRQGGVAKSYLDPLAARLQSIRMGETGRGWKRFLVFAELTKSKKGADYVALFSYFSFEAWLRIVFAEGPRQVINGITLYSVAKANLLPEGKHKATGGNSNFSQFWVNFGLMLDDDRLQALVLLGMVWTLVIWIFAAICLALSVVLYLIFLWHHIPSGDGGLARYCRIKINRRMERIVKTKVDTALKQENELRTRQEAMAVREGLEMKKQPTLPSLDPAVGSLPSLSRQTTMTTLPEYTSRPGSARNSTESAPPVPLLPQSAVAGAGAVGASASDNPSASRPRRSDTSWSSYASNAPLMHQAADMAYSPEYSANSVNPYMRGPPSRTMTPGPNGPVPIRPPTAQSGRNAPYTLQPGSAVSGPPRPPSNNSNRSMPMRSGSWDQQGENQARRTPFQNNPYFPPILEANSGRSSLANSSSDTPAPGSMAPPSDRSRTPGPRLQNGPPADRSFGPPPRSMTAGPPERSFSPFGPPPRSLTAGPLNGGPSDRSFSPGPPPRSMTAGPSSDRPFSPGPPPRSLTAGPTSSDQGGSRGNQGPPRSLIAGPPRSFSPAPVGPPRSLTAGPQSERSSSPFRPPPRSMTGPLPERSFSPVPPPRSFSPAVPSARSSGLSFNQPTLPHLDTYDDALLDSYRDSTSDARSSTASSAWPLGPSAAHRPLAPHRQESDRSDVDDILGHY